VRLVWGARTERFYESGVDNGVLYGSDLLGVAWSGLISVSELPTGGDPRPHYFDGVKYLNLASAEEFEASITAYNHPPEFSEYDGVVAINNGLFATQQPRKPFSLSYRSLVGNDVDGMDHGYKIHLVYNALAAPSQRNNQTRSDSSDPITYSWDITTLPPAITGYKRTAHFVVDSRYTSELVLTTFTDILYGTDLESARIPDIEELLTIFA
jgi:hypothetical protein